MRIAIIGSGYTGMSIAKELIKDKKHEISIYEKDNEIGGMVKSTEINDKKVETYYRHIFKSDTYVTDLINDLNLKDLLVWTKTKMGYYASKRLYDFGTPLSLLRFKPLNIIDRIRFGISIIYLNSIKDYKKIENITAKKWLIKKCGNNVYKTIWKPLLNSKFGNDSDNVSMAWLWGKIKLRSSTSTKNGEQLGYIRGSYEVLTNELESYLTKRGVEIFTNKSIEQIERLNEKYLLKSNDSIMGEYDIVVNTTAYPIFFNMTKELISDVEMEKMNKVKYKSALVMILEARKSISKYYWMNISDDVIPFSGIIEHTNMISKREYENTNIIYLSKYLDEKDTLNRLNKEELFERYINSIKKINPDFNSEDVIKYEIYKERYAQPVITVNYSQDILGMKLSKQGIYMATLPQIYPEDRGMNYAIKLGVSVADQIKEDYKNHL